MRLLVPHIKGTKWEIIVFPNEAEKAREDKWLDKLLGETGEGA